MEKYAELKEHLKNVLKTAKKLGLIVHPEGGYSMGYDLNNLPPYAVGLFGALSIVEGQGARCKLGLTFDQTQSLEAGFDGRYPDKKKKKRKGFLLDEELMKIGAELTAFAQKAPRTFRSNYQPAAPIAANFDNWDGQPGQPVFKVPKNNFGNAHVVHVPMGENAMVAAADDAISAWQAKQDKKKLDLGDKAKLIENMMNDVEFKMAQKAPLDPNVGKILDEAEALLNEIDPVFKADQEKIYKVDWEQFDEDVE